MNILLTGDPRSGKTTVCKKLIEIATNHGTECGGILCPEVNAGIDRIGCDVENLITKEKEVMSRLKDKADFEGPEVGSYLLNPRGQEFGRRSLEAARSCDLVFIDEIGKVEIEGKGNDFMDTARELLASDNNTNYVVIVRNRLKDQFLRKFPRFNFDIFEVNKETRDILPEKLFRKIIKKDIPEK